MKHLETLGRALTKVEQKKVNGGWATCWCQGAQGVGFQILYTGELTFYELLAAQDEWCRAATNGAEYGSCSVN